MERVIQLARRLGQAIAEHDRCAALNSARAAFHADETAQQLQKDYDAAATLLQTKLAQGAALEPEEKRNEADLRSRVAGNTTLGALIRAQADFHELMTRVNEAIEEEAGLNE